MGIFDFFRLVPKMTAEEVKRFLKGKKPGDYNLVDVREAGEYEEGHLPGAVLIPLNTLEDSISEIDPKKETITYCASGVRSRAAAQILGREGFQKVFSMEGGIRAWRGHVAEGAPEAGTAFFSPGEKPEDFIYLSWILEEGTRSYYEQLSPFLESHRVRSVITTLIAAEERHKAFLKNLYREISKDPFEPQAAFRTMTEPVMEGGMSVSEALTWARGKGIREILELSMYLEANAYDRYVKMGRIVEDDKTKEIFTEISREEKEHLTRLTALFESLLSREK